MTVKKDLDAADEGETRRALKRAARELFAVHGVAGVSVRDIAQAAAQKNQGAVAYYFSTKDGLIAEILIDGARRIEERRRVMLSVFEQDGGPHTVRDAVAAIVLPSARFSEEDAEYGSFFTRFLTQLSYSHPEFADETLKDRWNTGYQRCLRHIRRLLPNTQAAELNRRFVFMGITVSALLSQREIMLADRSRAHAMWRSDEALEDIIRTTAALLEA